MLVLHLATHIVENVEHHVALVQAQALSGSLLVNRALGSWALHTSKVLQRAVITLLLNLFVGIHVIEVLFQCKVIVEALAIIARDPVKESLKEPDQPKPAIDKFCDPLVPVVLVA